MPKLCVIYNVFGGHGRDNTNHYLDAFRTIVNQTMNDIENYKLAISGCMLPENIKNVLANEFFFASCNYIDTLLPVNITFNHTVEKMRKAYGDFDAYVYVDSGVNFHNLPDGMEALYQSYKNGPYAIVAADPFNDKGYEWWGAHLINAPCVELPVGKAMNAHCNLYSHALIEAYGRILPDIFGMLDYTPDTSESIHSFLCAAIGKKMLLDKRVTVFHIHNMDGGSAFRKETYSPLKPLMQTGYEFGMGWEECNPDIGMIHNPDCYDAEGFAKDPNLKTWIKNNLYLKTFEFDYNSIISTFRKGA